MNRPSSLILEIQSGLVDAIIASEDAATGEPRIIHSVSVPISRPTNSGSAHLLANMSKALSEALDMLGKLSSPSLVRGVFRTDCILSSPWIVSQTKSIRIHYAKETVVTSKLIATAIAVERQKMSALIGDTAGEADKLTWIEQKIFEIKINGYQVADFRGKKARELEIFFAVSMSPDAVVGHVSDIVGRHTGLDASKIIYHSSILIGYAVSRENAKDETGHIVVHIHGELSDIAVVRRGITTRIGSFPFGYSALAREVSAWIGESEMSAHSKIALHSSKSLHGDEAARVADAVDAVLAEKWSGQFLQTIMPELSKNLSVNGERSEILPRNVLLIVPAEYYPHFKKALEKPKEPGIFDKIHAFFVSHVNTHLIYNLLHL